MIDELDLQPSEELTEIPKNFTKFSFPAVTICRRYGEKSANHSTILYFNAKTKPYLPDRVKWYVTSEYIIMMPSDDPAAWRINRNKMHGCTKATFAQAVLPSEIAKEKRIKPGTYKLYKYKEGLAFKRYERIAE